VPKSPWPLLLAFVSLIVVVYAIKGYRAAGKPKGGDALVLAQLKKAGSDLSKPHSIEFFVYLPTQEAAQKAAEQIRSKGFDVKVDRAAQGPNWLCFATKSMVPELAAIEAIRSDFDGIARLLGGEYDGWGTPVVK
jgi:regulator of RNase E activity RraB